MEQKIFRTHSAWDLGCTLTVWYVIVCDRQSQPGRTHGFLPTTFRVVTSLSVMTFVFNYYLLSMLLCIREYYCCFEEVLGIKPRASRTLGKSSTAML